MTKMLTYHKPSGEWGIEGVYLSTLPPPVYEALAKLMRLEHPLCNNCADMLRLASEEEMAVMLAHGGCKRKASDCERHETCDLCWLDWLKSPAGERITAQKLMEGRVSTQISGRGQNVLEMMVERTEIALALVKAERQRQDTLWGDQSENHSFEWLSILGEEYGELCEAVNETYFQNPAHPERGGYEKIIREATQVAAVAVAIVETMNTQC